MSCHYENSIRKYVSWEQVKNVDSEALWWKVCHILKYVSFLFAIYSKRKRYDKKEEFTTVLDKEWINSGGRVITMID